MLNHREGEIQSNIQWKLDKVLDEREEEMITYVTKKINSVYVKLNDRMQKRENEVNQLIYRLQ